MQETTLTIEYIPLVLPPEPQEPRAHDEWVSAVSGFNPKFIVTGSYDNYGRYFSLTFWIQISVRFVDFVYVIHLVMDPDSYIQVPVEQAMECIRRVCCTVARAQRCYNFSYASASTRFGNRNYASTSQILPCLNSFLEAAGLL